MCQTAQTSIKDFTLSLSKKQIKHNRYTFLQIKNKRKEKHEKPEGVLWYFKIINIVTITTKSWRIDRTDTGVTLLKDVILVTYIQRKAITAKSPPSLPLQIVNRLPPCKNRSQKKFNMICYNHKSSLRCGHNYQEMGLLVKSVRVVKGPCKILIACNSPYSEIPEDKFRQSCHYSFKYLLESKFCGKFTGTLCICFLGKYFCRCFRNLW